MGETFGRFQVHESLGESDVATVNRAELSVNGFAMEVALRRLKPHAAMNEEAVKWFVHEAQLGMHLQHANVAQTYEIGNLDGRLFVATELIPGRSLAALMGDGMRMGQPIPISIALAILCQVCDALDYVHNLGDPARQPLGLLHGELLPAHMIVAANGLVKLVGFGRMEPSSSKLGYLSPEYVATGQRDARVDLFALGVVAYEMLANRPLFWGNNDAETLERLRSLSIPPPSTFNPQLPADIDGIVLGALVRDPAQRWQHAAQLRNALLAVAQRYGAEVAPPQISAWLHQPIANLAPANVASGNVAPPIVAPPIVAPANVAPANAAPANAAPSKSAPANVAPANVAPPNNPDLWGEDDNMETQIQSADPRIANIAQAIAATAPEPRAPEPRAPEPHAPRAPGPPAPTAGPPEPRAPEPRAPIVPSESLAPERPAPMPRLPTQDPEMGPEPTQIGAMPLISFGDQPLVALIGDSPARPSVRSGLPEASGISMPEPDDPRARRRRIAVLVAIAGVIVLVTVLVLVL